MLRVPVLQPARMKRVFVAALLTLPLLAALAVAPEVEIINPENLHVKSRMDSGGQSSESDLEELKQLAWSAGADICVLGDFAPYNDEIGISLRTWNSDRSSLLDIYGSIPLNSKMRELSPTPLTYTPPADGIFTAGSGGVSTSRPLNPSIANSAGQKHESYGAGLVSADLVVGINGAVRQVAILDSSSALLASRAKKIYALQYAPAKAPDGTPVPARIHVTFELTVAADGSVRQATVLESPNRTLSDQAIESVRTWKFKPAISPGGQPLEARVPTEIMFTLYQK